jgi:heat shock protein HslJ
MIRQRVRFGAAVLLLLIGGYVAFTLLRTFMPFRTLNIIGSTWSVATIGPKADVKDIQATLEFRPSGDAILESHCGRRTLGFDIDGDDVGISLVLLSSELRDCPPAESQLEAALAERLKSTESLSVQSDTAIQLHGQETIGLVR